MHPTIGILAGMGPRSTGPFLERVLDECQRQYGATRDIEFPRMMICSLPAPFEPDQPLDGAAMEAALISGVSDLERAGAAFIAIPCNTAHVFLPQVAARASVPILDMVALAMDALPPVTRVAVVAARETVGLYREALMARGRVAVTVDQDAVDELIGATRIARVGFAGRWRQIAA